MGIVEQYLLQLNTEKQRFHRAIAILMVLSLLVTAAVAWSLRLTGITMANDANCGITEHQHCEECSVEKTLICGYPEVIEALESEEPEAGETETAEGEAPEAAEAAAPEEPAHVHGDECYESAYTCGFEEHIHALSCYCDPSADIETAEIWAATLPGATGLWANDLAAIAMSQLGSTESEKNFIAAEDGQTRKGITRYGQWYGNPYGDWSGMFTLFCLSYANVPQSAVPQNPGVQNMMLMAQDAGILSAPDTAMAAVGNLLFADTDYNGSADHSLIVTAAGGGSMTAVGGDIDNCVAALSLSDSDSRVLGYINIDSIQNPPAQEPQPEPDTDEEEIEGSGDSEIPEEPEEGTDTAPEESTEPSISIEVELSEESETIGLLAQTANIDDAMYIWQWQVSQDGNEPWTDIIGADCFYYELPATEENGMRYYRLQGRKAPASATVYAITSSNSTVSEGDTITSGAISPFSVGSDRYGNVTVDVYYVPVDAQGNRITALSITQAPNKLTLSSEDKIPVADLLDSDMGVFHSAYLGTQRSVDVDNIESVWRYTWFTSYHYLAYETTDGDVLERYKRNDNSISLYLRYSPTYTVTFSSEGLEPISETVGYGNQPQSTEPGTWTRPGHILLGWTVDGDEQNVYTFEEIIGRPIYADVTYQAKWEEKIISVSYDLGEHADSFLPIASHNVDYGSSLSSIPTPARKDNSVTIAFDGWYLDKELSQPLTAEHKIYDNTTLYAKWIDDGDGYYVYFMDFKREDQTPLVLATYSLAEGRTIAPHTPGNPPAGTAWDGKWYLDEACSKEYNFSVPVSQMTDYLQGTNNRDLYLYPSTLSVCRAIFVTLGTKIDPVAVPVGQSLNLNEYIPERAGYIFAGWTLKDGSPVSGYQTLTENTTYYATWRAGYVPFEALLRIENPNDTGVTQADTLGTWYALAGSQIEVDSVYTGTGNNRRGTHTVWCVLDGTRYPVYTDASLSQQAMLDDVYETYFVYNNTGTDWTDEVNWDDVYTGGELPYSTRPISSAGDTIINFDYMRIRSDVVFSFSNQRAYIDLFKLYQNGLITGSITYSGSAPTATGRNVSATGVSGNNMSWSYTAASGTNSGTNYYTLHDVKYGQRIYEVYPVGGSWLSIRSTSYPFSTWDCNGTNFTSRREDLSAAFFSGSGRAATAYQLTAEFSSGNWTALMYAIECLPGETADFTIGGVGYKVHTELCEVVNSTGNFSAKELLGCEAGVNAKGSGNNNYYSGMSNASFTSTVGGTSVKTLFGTTYWSYYDQYTGIDQLSDIKRAYIFYYDRIKMSIQFNFAYDSDGDGINETVSYDNIAFGQRLEEYQFGAPDFAEHPQLQREGYEFAGWLDSNGFVLEADDWASLEASGDSENSSMVFIAKWEKVSNNIVEYYEDVSASAPFEYHYFDDGEFLPYPNMVAYPQGWVWKEYGEEPFIRFDWDVPMYGEYGVQETRHLQGEDRIVNVIRIYGTWDESHTKVVYDPNPAQGGIPGTAPVDSNEYTIWQSEVSVMSQGGTANMNPDAVFVGWLLDRNGIVYQPGNHVGVHWPRTMIFTAQWATAEEVVYLRYDPNGGTPANIYPNDIGFAFRENASTVVWDNTGGDGAVWFNKTGYSFTGWNTMPDGSGTAYQPGDNIQLTEDITTLYAQWQAQTHSFVLNKLDRVDDYRLSGAEFRLYKLENNEYVTVESMTTDSEGRIVFSDIETAVMYKLVETRPPNGYAIITKEVYFRLNPSGTSVSLEFWDPQGSVISAPDAVTGEYLSGLRQLTLTVYNLAGFELPATGGIGTPLYLLCGVILMLAPFVYLFRSGRRHERRQED